MLTQQLKSQILKRNELSLPLLCSLLSPFLFSFCSTNLFSLKIQQASKKRQEEARRKKMNLEREKDCKTVNQNSP